MKRGSYYFMVVMLSVVCGCFTACKKEEPLPERPRPVWGVKQGIYTESSMTAVVILPKNLQAYAQDDDMLAAFAGNECRGIGELIDGAYYILIKGAPDEYTGISFQYYSARNKYLYTTASDLAFKPDARFGSVDEPEVLALTIVK